MSCWGANHKGQLGNGTISNGSSVPAQVPGITGATQLSASDNSTCAVVASGRVRCWGGNLHGQLGNGSTTDDGVPTPVEVRNLTGATEVSVGISHTCARRSDGTARCWGDNYWGQLGDGDTQPADQPRTSPVVVVNESGTSNLIGVETIAVGKDHTCATVANGTVRCWGSNSFGQVGNGVAEDEDERIPHPRPSVVADVVDAVDITAGATHTCALIVGGTVDCWGGNQSGQLGRTYVNEDPNPTAYPVGGLTGATAIAAGFAHTCVIVGDGTARCWGDNNSGQLGNGTTVNSNVPVVVNGVADATSIAAGIAHSCALVPDGEVRCWGAGQAVAGAPPAG